nr:MAG TPA: hypothetical protein [Caudoviricetes sp.]
MIDKAMNALYVLIFISMIISVIEALTCLKF